MNQHGRDVKPDFISGQREYDDRPDSMIYESRSNVRNQEKLDRTDPLRNEVHSYPARADKDESKQKASF